MSIYGVALLAFCIVVGKGLGFLIGELLGIGSDVGGIGFAMLLFMLLSPYVRTSGEADTGIRFWATMYLPVYCSMVASLNVFSAVHNGLLPLYSGLAVVGLMYCFVVPISGLARR